MYYTLSHLPYLYSLFVLQILPVRIHSNLVVGAEEHTEIHPASFRQIATGTWIKLWYILRALDQEGSGYWRGSLQGLLILTGIKQSTIYQYLREGKRAGAFRRYRVTRGKLRVALGGLNKVARNLNLGKEGFGPVGEVSLHTLLSVGVRPIATGIIAQKEQQKTRYAAWASLPNQVREKYKLPYPKDFFRDEAASSSRNLQAKLGFRGRRGLKCVVHVGRKRIFVSAGFVPQGVSQRKIARHRGRCVRTVQNHIAKLGGIQRKRQIVQNRAAYEQVKLGIWCDLEMELPDLKLEFVKNQTNFLKPGQGTIPLLTEKPGLVGKPYGYAVNKERFFMYGGRHWIYRTNLYEPVFKLKTMRAKLAEFKAILNNDPLLEKSSRTIAGAIYQSSS